MLLLLSNLYFLKSANETEILYSSAHEFKRLYVYQNHIYVSTSFVTEVFYFLAGTSTSLSSNITNKVGV